MHDCWGTHIMIDASGLECGEDKLNDVEYLKSFVKDMLEAVKMEKWGDPIIRRLTKEDGVFPDHLSGFTVVQTLHTSSMTIMHVCDKANSLYFDLFSCAPYSNDVVVDVLKRYFQPTSMRVNFLTRQA